MPLWTPIGGDLLGAKHLANNLGQYEPQRGHNFELLIAVPGGGDSTILLKTTETAMSISHNSDPIMLQYMNETIYIAGRPMYQPGSVTFRDMVTEPVFETLERWSRLVYDVFTSQIGFAADYKSMASLTLYDVKGGNSRTWDLIGIWPQDISSEPPSYVSGDIMRITVNFQYDKAVPLFAY